MNYHPDYGLPDYLRIQAVSDAKKLNVKQSAEINRVSVPSIYRWRKALEQTNEQL